MDASGFVRIVGLLAMRDREQSWGRGFNRNHTNLKIPVSSSSKHMTGATGGAVPEEDQGICIRRHVYVANKPGLIAKPVPVRGELAESEPAITGITLAQPIRSLGCPGDNLDFAWD